MVGARVIASGQGVEALMSNRKTTLLYLAPIVVMSLLVGMVIASRLDLSPASTAQTDGRDSRCASGSVRLDSEDLASSARALGQSWP